VKVRKVRHLRETGSAFHFLVGQGTTLIALLPSSLAASELFGSKRPGFVLQIEFISRLKVGEAPAPQHRRDADATPKPEP